MGPFRMGWPCTLIPLPGPAPLAADALFGPKMAEVTEPWGVTRSGARIWPARLFSPACFRPPLSENSHRIAPSLLGILTLNFPKSGPNNARNGPSWWPLAALRPLTEYKE